MNYTQFITELIEIICVNADLQVNQIALTEDDCKLHWSLGYTPKQLFFEIWQQDAGNFYKLI